MSYLSISLIPKFDYYYYPNVTNGCETSHKPKLFNGSLGQLRPR